MLTSSAPYHLKENSMSLLFNVLLTLKCALFFLQKALCDCFCNCVFTTFWAGCIFLVSSLD